MHPETEHPRVLVRTENGVHEVGSVDGSAYIGDVLHGRAIIAALVEEGLFVPEGEIIFDDILHATDVDAWLAHRDEWESRSILSPEIVRQARDLLAAGSGEVLVLERGYAEVLRKR